MHQLVTTVLDVLGALLLVAALAVLLAQYALPAGLAAAGAGLLAVSWLGDTLGTRRRRGRSQ